MSKAHNIECKIFSTSLFLPLGICQVLWMSTGWAETPQRTVLIFDLLKIFSYV